MVNKSVLYARLEYIDKHLERIGKYSGISYTDFLNNAEVQDVVEYNLFQIVNHVIDLIEHIVVDERYGMPSTAYEAAQLLFEKALVDKVELEVLKNMIGFRNIVGHEYIKIDKKIVYDIAAKAQSEIKDITAKIVKKFL